jgi:CBS domain containing-hemolysin-like protein
MEFELGISCLLLILLTFLATIDMAFGQLSDVGLRRLSVEAENRAGAVSAFLKLILEDRPKFRFTLGAGVQMLLVAVSVLVTALSLRWFPDNGFVVVSLLIGLLVAGIFRQFIPRLLTIRNPEQTLLLLLPALRPFYKLIAFLADPWTRPFSKWRRENRLQENDAEEEEAGSDGNIQALIDVGAEEGILEEEEGELIHSILEFGDTRVSEVMTRRTEIESLPAAATVKEARDRMIDSKYSRLPVYRDQIDNVEGIIYVRDLLQCWADQNIDGNIAPLLRPAYFVPETKLVSDLLEDMQKAHVQLAMVVDEYGGVAGLVTVEDILEEIVGEIEDEDIEGDEIVEIVESEDGYYEVLGSTEIGKIERLFDMEIAADDFTTIAGLVIGEAGYVPRTGERLKLRGLDVEVLETDDRRIGRLRLRRFDEQAPASE